MIEIDVDETFRHGRPIAPYDCLPRMRRQWKSGGFPVFTLRHYAVAALALAGICSPSPSFSQELSRFDREQGKMMLNMIRDDLEKNYYDPEFRGLKMDEVFNTATDAIARATFHHEIYNAVAGPLLALDDSHTFFFPPRWSAKLEFGWEMQMIGDACYLVAIQPGSDAEAKGLLRGDRVLSVDGERPSRAGMTTMLYVHRLLAPRASSSLMIQSPGGKPREIIVKTKVTEEKRLWTKSADLANLIRDLRDRAYLGRHRLHELGSDLVIWKMPEFDLTREDVHRGVRIASKHPALILDMRGNPGGAVETLENMVGCFIEGETKIGDVKSRERMQPITAKKGSVVFGGKMVVLVDSDSGSAAELFARTMQLTGRAKVIGDRSGGAVMMSRQYSRRIGSGNAIFFGSSVTVADIIMPDGKSLEHAGVTPDEVMLPTGEDLAAGRDPVLSHAASLVGVTLDPAKAGALFPFEWKR
jgi:carboxyl-terminal processing protease